MESPLSLTRLNTSNLSFHQYLNLNSFGSEIHDDACLSQSELECIEKEFTEQALNTSEASTERIHVSNPFELDHEWTNDSEPKISFIQSIVPVNENSIGEKEQNDYEHQFGNETNRLQRPRLVSQSSAHDSGFEGRSFTDANASQLEEESLFQRMDQLGLGPSVTEEERDLVQVLNAEIGITSLLDVSPTRMIHDRAGTFSGGS